MVQTQNKTTKTTRSPKSKTEVTIPTNMSQRSIMKSLTLQAYYKKLLVGSGTIAAALCLFFGTGALLTGVTGGTLFQASVGCVFGDCVAQDELLAPSALDTASNSGTTAAAVAAPASESVVSTTAAMISAGTLVALGLLFLLLVLAISRQAPLPAPRVTAAA